MQQENNTAMHRFSSPTSGTVFRELVPEYFPTELHHHIVSWSTGVSYHWKRGTLLGSAQPHPLITKERAH
eukprot:4124925-Amphidinium_carterae.1